MAKRPPAEKLDPESLLGPLGLTYPVCIVRVRNETPCDWGSVIEAAAAEFTYLDGTTSRDAQPNLYLRCKGEATLQSQPLCVVKVYHVLRVRMDGKTYVYEDTLITPPKKCALEWIVGIKPVPAIFEESFAQGGAAPFELFVVGERET